MIIDPKLLELWQKQQAAAMAAPMAAPQPEPLPIPPVPPALPPSVPVPAGAEPDAAAQDAPQPVEAFGNSVKPPAAFNLVAFLRGLAEIVPRPPAPTRSTPGPAPAPPGHRPQGGALPMRQAIPGNPYLQQQRRRGLLDRE
jgi:hypothetical protein